MNPEISNETPQVEPEVNNPVRELEEDFYDAITSIVNGSKSTRPGALHFVHQIKNGEYPSIPDSSPEMQKVMTNLRERFRDTLDTEMQRAAEQRFFGGASI